MKYFNNEHKKAYHLAIEKVELMMFIINRYFIH